jgi:hypothetical protein
MQKKSSINTLHGHSPVNVELILGSTRDELIINHKLINLKPTKQK